MVESLPTTSNRTRDSVSRITPVIEKYRDDGERERRLSNEIVQAIRDEGLLKLWVPKEFGGDEADVTTFMQTVEALACADPATAWVYANIAAGNLLAAFLPPEGVRAVFAASPDMASPGSVAPTGHAVQVEGGYRLTGRWPLSSGCLHADWIGATGLVFEGDAPVMGPAGPDLKAFMVPASQVEVIDTWHSLGLRGTGSNDFTVSDVFVPEHMAFSIFTQTPQAGGHLYWTGIIPLFSMALVPVLLGVARTAIDAFVELAKSKTPTLSQDGLAMRPTIHSAVSHAEAQLGAARAYLYESAAELTLSAREGEMLPEAVEAKRLLACTHAAETCVRVVDDVYHLAGASPIRQGHVLERCLRDVHTAAQHLLVSPVWWEKTGQSYFGLGIGMP
jgi:alkylation response protein AidB-like acyl-CoA dehydrogenase